MQLEDRSEWGYKYYLTKVYNNQILTVMAQIEEEEAIDL